MITIKEINYKNFGRCVEVSNGTIDFVATLDIGPRIIRFGFVGGENAFWEDIDRVITEPEPFTDADFGVDKKWYIYGGHRLWLSPEASPRTYYPEDEPVKYEKIADGTGVRLTPPPQKWTNVQNEIEIAITGDNSVEIKHFITNIGAYPSEFAIWALSVMAQNGKSVIPMPAWDTGLVSNRQMAIWPYTKMNDERVYWGDKYITLKHDVNVKRAIKFGINSEHGWAAYFNHGNMFVKRFPVDGKVYPDGGMSYETYANEHFFELESLGELKNVAPGETITHKEQWQLFADVPRPSDDEGEIAAVVGKYI
ncbi:MAG: DUF4380 domain-containing protein [Oscillospiraceae bacterium]|nr:DUF4380 domain-containing protein [Oscillospiraceae bacterium]